MQLMFSRSSSEWLLHKVVFEIIVKLSRFDLILWFALTIISMTLTSYLNVSFFTTIIINIDQGLKYLFLLIVFENITAYCSLKQRAAKRTFILDFLERFRTKLNQRVLGTHWLKIKLSDQEDTRQKIERACTSVKDLLEDIVDKLKEIYRFFLTVIIISSIFPISTVFIGVIYMASYALYLKRQSTKLLEFKTNLLKTQSKLHSKYARANTSMFEYVIHHEKDEIIRITNQLKTEIERQWFSLNYRYDCLSFNEDVIGKLTTFLIIFIYYALGRTNTYIIPLYHYLSTLTTTIHKLIMSYIQWVKFKRDYDLVQCILEECQERPDVEQVDLYDELQIGNLSFRYENARGDFRLQHRGYLTFQRGESILIKGDSGAGNSA